MRLNRYHLPCIITARSVRLLYHPYAVQVQAYIRAYARHFSIYEHIKLQCKLVQLRRHDGGGWTVLYHDLRLDKFFQVMREPP